MSIPMLFVRDYAGKISYVVMNPDCCNWRPYDSTWMRSEHLQTDGYAKKQIYTHDVDICKDENVFVFDDDDPEVSFRHALRKMQELWAQLEIK